MIASSTKETYLKNARALEKSFRRRGLKRSAASFFDEIERRSGSLRSNTLRMYKRSAVYRLESIGDQQAADQLRAMFDDAELTTTKKRRLVRRVPDELVDALLSVLSNRPTIIAKKTHDLLLAMIVTGLRPTEWELATIEGNVLTVKNAKYKEGVRANGEYRELELLPSVTTDERAAIERCMALFSRSPYQSVRPNISVEFKSALGTAIEMAGLTKWFYRLRIYDFRHQFSADAKQEHGIGAGVVAAAMGHSVEDTAVSHYGKKKHGSGRSKVMPSKASIAKVRRLYKPDTPAPSPSPTPSPSNKF